MNIKIRNWNYFYNLTSHDPVYDFFFNEKTKAGKTKPKFNVLEVNY